MEAFVRAVYKAQLWVQTATDTQIAEAMMPFFPDTDVATLEYVAKSYRATDSWMTTPMMSEDSFNRLQDIMEMAGELGARVEFENLIDNSFAEKVVGEKKN